jgi:uncharacterized OsmC-like protein
MSNDSRVNDVNLEAVAALAQQIRSTPAVAKTTWKSKVHWNGAFRSQAQSRDLGPVPSDEPAVLGRGNTAPNPVEQLLGALGNCLAVGHAANASVAGIRIRSLDLELEGNIDSHTFLGLGDGNAGYESIRVKVNLQSDATPSQLAELHRKVVGTSPVGHSLSRAVPVQVDLL